MDFSDGLFKQKKNSTVKLVEKYVVMNPVKGRMILLHEVSDPAFAKGIPGVSMAVIPAEGCVYVPVDRTVAAVFLTEYAIGLMNDDGMKVLIYVGTDTMTMKDNDFSLEVGQGGRVTGGQLLLTFEPEKIEAADHGTTTMMLVSNAVNLSTLEVLREGDVDAGQKPYCLEQGRKSANSEITRTCNNNVIMAHDEDGQRMVAIDKGLAFMKKPGGTADTKKIEKLFTLRDKVTMGRLKQLMKNMPSIYLEIYEKTVRILERKLDTKLNESTYLTLTGHIGLPLEREHNGIVRENSLPVSIKRLYKKESGLVKDAAVITERKTGVAISEDEIGSITLHIANAPTNQQLRVTVEAIRIASDILAVVKDCFGSIMDEESPNYQWFVRHLQFFIRRVLDLTDQPKDDSFPYKTGKKQLPEVYACVKKVNRYVKE